MGSDFGAFGNSTSGVHENPSQNRFRCTVPRPHPRPPVQGPPTHVTFSPPIKCPVLHAAQLLSHINWIFAFYCSEKMLLLMYHINLLIPKSSLLLGNFAANLFATSAKDI